MGIAAERRQRARQGFYTNRDRFRSPPGAVPYQSLGRDCRVDKPLRCGWRGLRSDEVIQERLALAPPRDVEDARQPLAFRRSTVRTLRRPSPSQLPCNWTATTRHGKGSGQARSAGASVLRRWPGAAGARLRPSGLRTSGRVLFSVRDLLAAALFGPAGVAGECFWDNGKLCTLRLRRRVRRSADLLKAEFGMLNHGSWERTRFATLLAASADCLERRP